MLILYKGETASPPLFEVDARGWLAAGWQRRDPTPTPQQETPAPKTPVIDVEQYLKDLWQEQGWLGIKEIAQSLNIAKPSEGWDAAIPLIVKKGWKPRVKS